MKIFIVAAFLLVSETCLAQTFSFKPTADSDQKIDLSFDLLENNEIKFHDVTKFQNFAKPNEKVSSEKIPARTPTSAENAISTSLMILTGLFMVPLYYTYDLGADLRLFSMRGLIFFIFPFERHSLYRKCGGKELLIGVSAPATEEQLKSLVSLEEAHKICDADDNTPPVENIPTSS